MRNSRWPLVTLLLLGISSLGFPLLAHAAIPYWGPIIPLTTSTIGNTQSCPLGWAALILVANNIISFGITIVIAFVAPLSFGYAGFLMVVSPTNIGDVSKARSVMINTVVGIVIALAAYGIVGSVLGVLYNASAVGGGQWYSLITSGGQDPCMKVAASLSQSTPGSGVGSTATSSGGTAGLPLADNGQGTCNPNQVQVAAENDGFNMSTAEAQTLACISSQESSCGTKITGAASSAGGAWQVLMGTNAPAYNNNACETAAGVSGPLNCQNGFSGGVSLNNTTSQECQRAASNVSCAVAAANYMVQARCPSGNVNQASCYADWTTSGDPNHVIQQQCVNTYNPGS